MRGSAGHSTRPYGNPFARECYRIVFADTRRDIVLWITYLLFSLAVLSCAVMSLAFAGVVANRGLSRGIFKASAIMSVVYTALSLATGQLVG
jgi:hypothetical protein